MKTLPQTLPPAVDRPRSQAHPVSDPAAGPAADRTRAAEAFAEALAGAATLLFTDEVPAAAAQTASRTRVRGPKRVREPRRGLAGATWTGGDAGGTAARRPALRRAA